MWGVLQGEGREYTRDHLVGHVEANKGAAATANDHGKFKKQFDEWLMVTGRWEEAGALIGKIREQREREQIIGYYLLDEYRHHGKREEQMKALVSRGKATFERYLECARAWDSPLVRSVASACPRTNREVGERLKTQLTREKYDINFGIMYRIRRWSGVENMEWDQHPGRERVGKALIYLLACMMFDIGMRKSNICEGKNRNVNGTNREDREGSGKDSGEDDGRKGESHCQEVGHWEFLVDEPERGERWINGGPEMAEFLQGRENELVTLARSRYVTSKASRKGKGKELSKQAAVVGRRTELEAEFLNLLLNYLRWNRHESKEQPLMKRRKFSKEELNNSEKKTGVNSAKAIRCEDLVAQLKRLATEEGVSESHASAGSFRKGNVSTGVLLGGNAAEEREKELERIRNRGGKWVSKSKTTEAHYLNVKDNRGPMAMVASWEEALTKDQGFEDWKHRQGAGK